MKSKTLFTAVKIKPRPFTCTIPTDYLPKIDDIFHWKPYEGSESFEANAFNVYIENNNIAMEYIIIIIIILVILTYQ